MILQLILRTLESSGVMTLFTGQMNWPTLRPPSDGKVEAGERGANRANSISKDLEMDNLKQKIEALERENETLKGDNAAMAELMKESKNNAAMVTHELCGPLMCGMGYLEFLCHGLSGDLPEGIRDKVEAAYKNIKRVNSMSTVSPRPIACPVRSGMSKRLLNRWSFRPFSGIA